MHKKGNGNNLKSKESHKKNQKKVKNKLLDKSCESHLKFMRNSEKFRKK